MRIQLFTVILLTLSLKAFSQSSPIDTLYSFKSFDGTVISFQIKGSGHPVLLIHGFIVNSDSWKKSSLYADLLTSGFMVITLDLRGNGRSDRPHKPEAYASDAEAKDISALADILGLKQYSVVGYSRGAIIASRVLMLDSRVDKAVLGGMGSDFTDPNWPRRIMFYEALSGKPVKELEGVIKYIQDAGLDQQALACMQKEQPSTSKEEFARVKKPVLVICGSEDEDNGSSKTLAALIPGSQYASVPGNHNNASRSKEFANEVITFLKSSPKR
jgi:pimeloyl-ACP methyl ester carboxylesterase